MFSWLLHFEFLYEMLLDSKGVVRSHKSNDRQCNCEKKKAKGTNNDLQNPTQKTNDRATRTPLNSEDELALLKGKQLWLH